MKKFKYLETTGTNQSSRKKIKFKEILLPFNSQPFIFPSHL